MVVATPVRGPVLDGLPLDRNRVQEAHRAEVHPVIHLVMGQHSAVAERTTSRARSQVVTLFMAAEPVVAEAYPV